MQVSGQGLKLTGEAELLSLQLLKTWSKGEGEYILGRDFLGTLFLLVRNACRLAVAPFQ